MADIKVSTEEMRQVAGVFANTINEWQVQKDRIWTLLTELDEMWDGDANEQFNALAAADKPKFDELVNVMQAYCDALNRAAQTYDEAENTVSGIVRG